MSNPNPQDKDKPFKGIRDVGYKQNVDPTDIMKFGKRVFQGEKITKEDVLKHHLKQMR